MKTPAFNLLSIMFIAILWHTACQPTIDHNIAQPTVFKKEFINQHNGYSEAVVITSGTTKTIYISGQIGEGQDLETQMRSAIKNMTAVLEATGADMKDVVKMNTYIVNYNSESLDTFRAVRKEMMGDTNMPASTLVGVDALAREEWLIEIEAIAIIEYTS